MPEKNEFVDLLRCNHELAPGETCQRCGAYECTEEESLEALRNAQPAPYDKFVDKFHDNDGELSAMIDIKNKATDLAWDEEKINTIVKRIESGELPSQIFSEMRDMAP